MKSKIKIIQADEETHAKAKDKAHKRGMTIKGYIKYLVEKDVIE